jgi:non-heme chloroperoxidase
LQSVAAKLALIEGGPHGINATHADRFNEELLAFLNS